MARWQPNALERLLESAMQLFAEHGYDRTTTREIAEHAGLTERTFFRYFADKREVLFSGSEHLQELIQRALAEAPATLPPLQVVARALEATSEMFEERRAFAGRRRALIFAHPELHERELIKLASLGRAMAQALQQRGASKSAAELIAETGILIFKLAFERWLDGDKTRDLAWHVRAVLGELSRFTAASCSLDESKGSASTPSPGSPPDAAAAAAPSNRRRSATTRRSR
jgi:AcrR family transcriptional regulator